MGFLRRVQLPTATIRTLSAAVGLFSLTSISATLAHDAQGSVKIMPLGDSITQGSPLATAGSYRRVLYDLLTSDDVAVDFVGELSDGAFADPDHEGLTGQYIDGIWGQVASGGILETYTPDVILLIIGTNNIWNGAEDPAYALSRLGLLLGSIGDHGLNAIKVLVGSIPPIDVAVAGSTISDNVGVFNAGIPAVVAAAGANFYFVDTHNGLTTSDLADGVHPNDAGNYKIANNWEPAIITALADCCRPHNRR